MCLHPATRKSYLLIVLVLAVILSPSTGIHARIIYVDAGAQGENTGLDWANAWPCLQNALAEAQSGDEVWVAAGIYRPDEQLSLSPSGSEVVSSGDPKARFRLDKGISLLGGFPRGGGNLDTRAPQVYETILSGDLLGNDGPNWAGKQDNSHSIIVVDVAEEVIIDGFTISGAESVPACSWCFPADIAGGGIEAYDTLLRVRNCAFYGNRATQGGAIWQGKGGWDLGKDSISDCIFMGNWARWGGAIDGDKVIVSRCQFIGNSAGAGGGALSLHRESQVIDCWFHNNSTERGAGGAVYFNESMPTGDELISGCTFTGNYADSWGGALLVGLNDDVLPVTNCSFIGNTAQRAAGGVCVARKSRADLINCILWGNVAPEGGQWGQFAWPDIYPQPRLHNCNIQRPASEEMRGNFSLDPQLTPDGHLTVPSPLIDLLDDTNAGSSQSDLDGDMRPTGKGLDLGADEFVDSDKDRLPDWWEKHYFNDPNAAAPQADPDQDGLTNLEEYELYSSNPVAQPIHVNPTAGPLQTLKQAIAAAQDGDTILVPAGTYQGEDNKNLDFAGKRVVLRAPQGPERTIIDCQDEGRAFYFGPGITAATAVIGFTLTNGHAEQGGAIHCEFAHPQIRNCVIRGNRDPVHGVGGIYGFCSFPALANCSIQDSGQFDIWADRGGVRIAETVRLEGDAHMSGVMLYGPGTLSLAGNSHLELRDCQIHCDILGPGTIEVPLENSLFIERQAVIDLAGDNGAQGQFLCDGLLQVRDNAAILNANVVIRRARLEDNAIMHNCVINAEAGDPFGQFFVEDSAMIGLDRLVSDGDRYLDVDPTRFQGSIDINSITVHVTEGMGTSRGGLFELRGRPGLAGDTNCHPDNAFLCQTNSQPAWTSESWTIDTLELQAGAKLNLTNRFDFQKPYDMGGHDEVLYVNKLILGPGSILNTGFQQVYYQTLDLDPTAKLANIPLLGFSLNNISFDNDYEYQVRVSHNNHEDHRYPQLSRLHVLRLPGQDPDPNGRMQLVNLIDISPGSLTLGQVVHARAKGLFAKSSEDELLVQFEYLFCAPDGELVVYLSDVPELLARDDPTRPDHYVEVARVAHPPAGQPGSMGSDTLAVFTRIVSVEHLNFVKGTRVEFELLGPEGTCVLINNWDPAVRCVALKCGDVAGDAPLIIDAIDFLAVMSEMGNRISDVNTLGGTAAWCLDSPFSLDGIVTLEDGLAIEWAMEGSPLPCYQTAGQSSPQRLNALQPMDKLDRLRQDPLETREASLWVMSKSFDPQQPTRLADSLYTLNEDGVLGEELPLGEAAHLGSRLISDGYGKIHQLDLEQGLLDPHSGIALIPAGRGEVKTEPRYGQPATVHLGRHRAAQDPWTLPMQDIAFDAQGYAYVVPVLVDPVHAENDRYRAAAKLKLDPNQTPAYEVIALLDTHSLEDSGQYEIEVDGKGKVYLLRTSLHDTGKPLWIFDQATGNVENFSTPVSAPICLHVSQATDRLFLASSLNATNATTSSLYAMDIASPQHAQVIEIQDMGHITGITEDPHTGALWVLGFSIPKVPTQEEIHSGSILGQGSFFKGHMAKIEPEEPGPVRAAELTESGKEWTVPFSIVWAENAGKP